jgi:hypothetical protein
MPAPPNPIEALLEFTEEDEKYVNMMLKKEARRTLQKYRKNPQPKAKPVLIDPEIDRALAAIEARMGHVKGSIEPIKNCRKCYFSTSIRVIGTDWYCQCTNVAKSSGKQGWKLVHCQSDLPCWREPDSEKKW